METLLTQRHPDIPSYIAKTCKKYTNLDINGNVIECLQREDTSQDFTDTTEVEKERVKLANYEKELNRLKRKANECKEEVPDYEKENSTSK